MKTFQHVCLWAGALALCLAMATDALVKGTWEGDLRGVKAVTLKLQEADGKVGGTEVFYIVRDEGSGKHNGSASPPMPLVDTRWDGEKLRFGVVNQTGETILFEMKVTGQRSADLTVVDSDGKPQRTIPIRSQR
ncbi:MAG: hypothetical protein ACLQU1_01100 [Bryobacteraceae bacterium]